MPHENTHSLVSSQMVLNRFGIYLFFFPNEGSVYLLTRRFGPEHAKFFLLISRVACNDGKRGRPASSAIMESYGTFAPIQ